MFAGDISIIFSLKHQITTLVQDRQKSIWKADVGLCELFPCVAVILKLYSVLLKYISFATNTHS